MQVTSRLFILLLPVTFAAPLGCYVPSKTPVPMRVLTQTPFEEWLVTGKVQQDVDWRQVNGTDYTGSVGNQMLPSPCGSCWAFASTGALEDRVAIASGGLRFSVSPQGLLDCATSAGSCNGGSPSAAYAFATTVGLTDRTCLPYRGMDNSNWGESPCAGRMCRNCDRFGACAFVPANETLSVKVKEHGTVRGVDAMKAEIAARGPIACLMYAHSDGFEAYRGGIIDDKTRYPGITHVVNVVGFGTATGEGEAGGRQVPYWIVRNSFGTNWGELGYYRVEMGLMPSTWSRTTALGLFPTRPSWRHCASVPAEHDFLSLYMMGIYIHFPFDRCDPHGPAITFFGSRMVACVSTKSSSSAPLIVF